MTRNRRHSVESADESRAEGVGPFGLVPVDLVHPATIGVALATAAYLGVFLSITNVVGGSARVVIAVTVALVAGVAVARVVDVRQAKIIAVVLFCLGLAVYYFSVPQSQRALFSIWNVAFDTLSLLTGLSVLRLTVADVWALSLSPGPTFLAWYLAARGRHVEGATVAFGTLGFFVLTGDAGVAATLLGVVGLAVAVGMDTLSVPGGLSTRWETLTVVITVMVLLSATLTVVPGGAAQPWVSDRGTPGIESSLVGSQEELQIAGSVQLSPEVRFTIQSTQEAYWHTGSFDRYTGDGWVRTGDTEPYTGTLDGPPGTSVRVEQTVTAETDMDAIPAAWSPISVDGAVARSAQVDAEGGIQPGTTVLEGDSINVESAVVQAPPSELREAGTEYPGGIEDRYTQLPESTPDRVGELTRRVAANADADNPYDTAVAVERYLQESKEYSLTVQKPDGDVADSFLFEMDAGYCVYFATAMVAMLRSEGIPAKFVTGYSSGERVGQDEWVVRGQDAHAWVMVYFPEHGWVEFDPTPGAEREEAREVRLAEARAGEEDGVDTDRTGEDDWTPTLDDETDEMDELNDSDGNDTEVPDSLGEDDIVGPDNPDFGDVDPGDRGDPGDPAALGEDPADGLREGSDDESASSLPDRETIGYGLLLLFGIVAGAHHVGATTRAYRAVWLRTPVRRRDPETDAARAYDRLEYLLERRYRPRRPGETTRAYLNALGLRGLDDRAYAVGETYERAIYGGGVDREAADTALRTVRRLALEETPVLRRFYT